MPPNTSIFTIFKKCADAISSGTLIHRESRMDKEFHFQNWFKSRLDETTYNHETGGRNSYPDFRLVNYTEGYEVKGLAYPGREINYDCNSQVPSGAHNGRAIFYVFGRYPAEPDGDSYPVLDLVICHGDFLNANHDYVHKNKSVKGFGSYGDIMIRDRKMYVAPTPYGLVKGAAHKATLILPEDYPAQAGFHKVGDLVRVEAAEIIVGYDFNLETNVITPKKCPNPSAGQRHKFCAYSLNAASEALSMNDRVSPAEERDED